MIDCGFELENEREEKVINDTEPTIITEDRKPIESKMEESKLDKIPSERYEGKVYFVLI